VVTTVEGVVESDDFLTNKIAALGEIACGLKRSLAETLSAISSAEALGGRALHDLLVDKKLTFIQCIDYVRSVEKALVKKSTSSIGFHYSPRMFATPSWTVANDTIQKRS